MSSRRDQMAGVDPFGLGGADSEARPKLSPMEADAALFGELARRDLGRQVVKPISIFHILPDAQQPRRAVPTDVRKQWSGKPADAADLFNAWLGLIDKERSLAGHSSFNVDDYLWAEAVEKAQRLEEEVEEQVVDNRAGPIERSFLRVVSLAVSIRRNGLANPVTIIRINSQDYRLETGERRWLAYHLLFAYFNGDNRKPDERSRWQNIPAIIVDEFDVWRQASENAARADLNAIGRARQFAILMMDLLKEQDVEFKTFTEVIGGGKSEREYYAQVIPYRVPNGKGEMLSNGLGVSHRAAFTRCRSLLGLPDEIWEIGDNLDLPEDELLRLARIEPVEAAIAEARKIAKIVASRNNPNSEKSTTKNDKPPTLLFTDPACKRGKRLFSRQNQVIAKELFNLRDGVGQASATTKQHIRDQIAEMRRWLDTLETALDKARESI